MLQPADELPMLQPADEMPMLLPMRPQVISLCEKPRDPPLQYIVADTPGQVGRSQLSMLLPPPLLPPLLMGVCRGSPVPLLERLPPPLLPCHKAPAQCLQQ